jgi:hypothetical protein
MREEFEGAQSGWRIDSATEHQPIHQQSHRRLVMNVGTEREVVPRSEIFTFPGRLRLPGNRAAWRATFSLQQLEGCSSGGFLL